MDTFEVPTVFDNPALLQDLGTYAEERQNILAENEFEDFGELPTTSNRSVLFLRVQSAANFYTTDQALMQHPPPVYVDISMLLASSHISILSLIPIQSLIHIF